MLMCCTAISSFAEENKNTVYYRNSDFQKEESQQYAKGQNRIIDKSHYEIIDTVYKVVFLEYEELSYAPDEDVVIEKDGRPSFIKARNLQKGDNLYLMNNGDKTLETVLVEEVRVEYQTSLHEGSYTTRSGFGMDAAIEGHFGTDQSATKKIDGRLLVRLNYDMPQARLTFLVGMETSEYPNSSNNNNRRFIAPVIGAEGIYKYYGGGNEAQHFVGSGLGFSASLYKDKYEDEFMIVNTRGYGINARAIPVVWIYSPAGSKFQFSAYAFADYRFNSNMQGMKNHGFSAGVGISVGGLFTNKLKDRGWYNRRY